MTEHPVKMVCDTCGGTDVVCDAFAAWNEELQMWEIASLHDKGSQCATCDDKCRIEEVPL